MLNLTQNPEMKPISPRKRLFIDSVCMLVYTTFVYVWALGLYPLGRDYAALATAGADLPFGARLLFAWELHAFGPSPLGYHLVNMLLMYACMQCLYHLTRFTVRGPVWLGTLAATLFMANPVHAESMLNLSGCADLVPALAALFALTLYAGARESSSTPFTVLSFVPYAFAVVAYRQNLFLVVVFLAYELLLQEPARRNLRGLLPHCVLALGMALGRGDLLTWELLRPDRSLAPVYFVFYPLGLLPENAQRFAASPWLGYLAAAVILGVLFLIHRKVRRTALLFGVLSAVVIRVAQADSPVDPVHLVGGGKLLFSNALFNVALVTVFHQMMQHPKWRKPVIILTTWLCVVFFVLQIQSVASWARAGAEIRRFQQQAAQQPAPFAVLPDIRYSRGAPLCLTQSVAFDTLFSKKSPAIPVWTLDAFGPLSALSSHVEEWSPDHAAVLFKARPSGYYPAVPTPSHASIGKTEELSPDSWRVRLTPEPGTTFPTAVIAVPQ